MKSGLLPDCLRHVTAFHLPSSGVINLPDQLIVMAIGGLPAPHRRQQLESEFAEAVEAMEGVVADLELVLVDWSDLARAIALRLPGSGHEERIIKDMREALDLYGYHHIVEPLQLEGLIAQRRVDPDLTRILMKMNKTAQAAMAAHCRRSSLADAARRRFRKQPSSTRRSISR